MRAASRGRQPTDLFQGGSGANSPPQPDDPWAQMTDLQHFPDPNTLMNNQRCLGSSWGSPWRTTGTSQHPRSWGHPAPHRPATTLGELSAS